MYCWKCGDPIQEGRDRCLGCDAPMHKPGFLERIMQWFVSGSISPTFKIEASQKLRVPLKSRSSVTDYKVQMLDNASPVDLKMFADKLSPEIRARMEAGESLALTMDDLPPEARAQVEESIARADVKSTRRVIKIRDSSGEMKTYHSLEEMPPDLRSSVQSMQAETVSTTVKEIYKFREADGQEKTYHSLDEMPPHVRAIIESVLNESKGRDSRK